MITGELKNKIDGLWDIFAAGGLVNPLEVIEQITYLMFIHDLDDSDNMRARESAMLGLPFQSIFSGEVKIGERTIDGSQLKWSVFHDFPADRMYMIMQEWVFPFIKNLHNDKNSAYSKYMESIERIEPLPDAFFNPLYEKLKMYYVTGGMPESVLMWTQARDVSAMQNTLSDIIDAYERDFAKHPDVSEFPKISMIWKSIPSQLARENKKFLYKVVKEGARAREYENALQWLVDARLVHKIYRSSTPGLPMSAYDDLSAFKIYLADVGVLRRLAQLAPTAFTEGNRLFTEFKGSLTENFVLQTLLTQFEVTPRYWAQNNPPYEVDFLIQRENEIFPVEVKAEGNIRSKSLKKFKELFPDKVKLRVRFSLDNLKLDEDVLNIPLFMADRTDRLLGLALNTLHE